jgi:hypothetical protein
MSTTNIWVTSMKDGRPVKLATAPRLTSQNLIPRLVDWREKRANAQFLAPPFPYVPASPLRNSMTRTDL